MECTAKQFEVDFFTKYAEWLKGGRVGPDPRREWQYWNKEKNKWDCFNDTLLPGFVATKYRWKPTPKRTVVIDGKTLVAPEREPLKVGDRYWFRQALCNVWGNYASDTELLESGQVFLTKEDAQAMFEAQKAQRLA